MRHSVGDELGPMTAAPTEPDRGSRMTAARGDAPIGPLARIDIADRADFHRGIAGMKAVQMFRISYVFLFALLAQVLAMSSVSAQQGHDACARDVSRFCRARMNDGDSAVLGCLKQHRSRLSRACDKVLTENGQ